MRAKEFLSEESTLNPNKLTKDINRFNNLVNNIKKGNPLYMVDGTPIVIKKTEAARIKGLFDQGLFQGRISLTGTDGNIYPLGSFLKTKDYGGQAVPPGAEGGDIAVAGIRPGQVFQHGDVKKGEVLNPEIAVNLGAFQASQLGQKIIANKYLDSQGRTGQAVKEIAKQIESGVVPTIPNLTKGELSNIQNYGFEYLGVQQVIKGTADFPNAEAFYNHVGANIADLVLYFPKSSGNPLADSYALVNRETENTIGMSSKGAKGGAPSSINGLKIPDALKQMIGKDPALTLVNLIQTTTPWKQPFVAVNWMHENFPGKLGQLEKFLPFDDRFLQWCESTWDNQTAGVPETLEEIPRQYRSLYKLVQSSIAKTADTPLFYDIRYYVKDALHSAIRSGVVPNFNQRMLELLGENFVVLKTDQVGKPGVGTFVTHVHWPAKINGKITFEHKDPAPKWKSSITWKLS